MRVGQFRARFFHHQTNRKLHRVLHFDNFRQKRGGGRDQRSDTVTDLLRAENGEIFVIGQNTACINLRDIAVFDGN